MRVTVLPKTILGTWSVGFALAFFAVPIVASFFVHPSEGLYTFVKSTIWEMYLTIGAGLGALATGVIATVNRKERSVLVFIAIIVGLVALFTLIDIIRSNV